MEIEQRELMSVSKPEIYIIQKLLEALVSELDLHYADSELNSLGPTFVQIANAVLYLEDRSEEVPQSATSIIQRFKSALN